MVLARANLGHSTARDLTIFVVSGKCSRLVTNSADVLTEVADTGLSGVVRSLELRDVDNMAAHGSRGNKAAVREVLKLVTVQVSTLLFLSSPVSGSSASAIPGSVEISLNNVEVVLDGAVNSSTLGPRDTSIGDENVKTTVEVLDGLVNGGLGLLLVTQIGLICLG